MKIHIEEHYDAFVIVVDGTRYYFGQEGTHEELQDVFEDTCPDAEVTYEEVY